MRTFFGLLSLVILAAFLAEGYQSHVNEFRLFDKVTELWMGLGLLCSFACWAIASAHEEARQHS